MTEELIVPAIPDGAIEGLPEGTLAELLARDIEPIRFVIDGLVPEGLTMLAGKPKLGKSWLALGLSMAICAGDPALGHNTAAGEVLYMALEDGARRLQNRVRQLGGNDMMEAFKSFHVRHYWETLDRGGLDSLERWMVHHPDTRLIVVDTWGKIQGELAGRDRYREEYKALGALQTFAVRHRVALVLVHHLRKMGADDWLEQLSGSQAVTAAADTLLGLFRERGQMDATLRLVSREVPERDLALKFNDGRWRSMGEAGVYRLTVERSEILEAMADLGGEAKVSQVAELVGKTSAATSKLLTALATDGAVRKVRYGVYSLTTPSKVVEPVEPTSTTTTTSTDSHKGSVTDGDGEDGDAEDEPFLCSDCGEPAEHWSPRRRVPLCDACRTTEDEAVAQAGEVLAELGEAGLIE